MLHIKIFPACLCCNYTDADVSSSMLSSYWQCKHENVCKLIEGQQPLIDTYKMTIDDACEIYGKEPIKIGG